MSDDDFPPFPTFTHYRPLGLVLIVCAIAWAVCFYYWPKPTFIVAGAGLGIVTSIVFGSSLRERIQRRKDDLKTRRPS